MRFKNIAKNIPVFLAISLLVLSSPFPRCIADPPDAEVPASSTEHSKKHHPHDHSETFFPMVKRKFFIDKLIIDKVTINQDTSDVLPDLDEVIGMLTLQATQLLALGDPYKMNFKSERMFDDVYKKYIEFSQIFSSLIISDAVIKIKFPYSASPIEKTGFIAKTMLRTVSRIDPFSLFEVNYWLKVPIEISLKPEYSLTLKQKIDWNRTLRISEFLSRERAPYTQIYQQMHELWASLPPLFPKV